MLTFSEISKKYGLNKKEIKIRFFRCMNYYFNDLLPLQKDIVEKKNMISILDDEISSKRKVIEESQPIVFSILQNLLNEGLNEHNILMAFNIFKTDLCHNMPYGDRTYLECLSKYLNRYPTVRDALEGLNNKILIKKSNIDKLALLSFEFRIFYFIASYNYYLFLLYYFFKCKTSIQIQKNLKILLIFNFNYLFPLLFCIVFKEPEKYGRSKFIKIEQNNNKNNKKEKERKNYKKNKNKQTK